MVALAIEFSCVVALFLWLYRQQVRDRIRLRRLPRRQMELELTATKKRSAGRSWPIGGRDNSSRENAPSSGR